MLSTMEVLKGIILASYATILSILATYVFHVLLMIFFYRRAKDRKPKVNKGVERFPLVTIQLPVYNEQYVIERLIRSVCDLDYPRDRLEVQILDDSTDETTEIAGRLVEEYRFRGYDIKLYHRENRVGYKAGALRFGLDRAKGEFIAIFDADFIPPIDFLKTTLPYFADERVGLVQTRWGHLNDFYSLLTRGQAIGLDAHFVIEQTARNKAGVFITFNGTGGVWRKQAILDAGNWEYDTLTEDLDLSYRAQLKGWKLVFLKDLVCPGEIPTEMNGLKIQQHRWAKGAVQTAKKVLPRVFKADLPLLVKFEAFVHLTNHVAYPLLLGISIFSLPLLIIKVNCEDARRYFDFISLFSICAFGHPLFYAYAQKETYADWKRRACYIPFLFAWGFGICVTNTRAVIEGLLNIKSPFHRTPKFRIEKKEDSWRGKKYKSRPSLTTLMELMLGLYTSLAVVYALLNEQFFALPFLAILPFSFFYMGILSLMHSFKK